MKLNYRKIAYGILMFGLAALLSFPPFRDVTGTSVTTAEAAADSREVSSIDKVSSVRNDSTSDVEEAAADSCDDISTNTESPTDDSDASSNENGVVTISNTSSTREYATIDSTNSSDTEKNILNHDTGSIATLRCLIEATAYHSAIAYCDQNTFDDSDAAYKYRKYAEARIRLDRKQYGIAYRILSDYCTDFLDANELMENIDTKVGSLDGVYDNMYASYYGMFCIIDHGSVCLRTTMSGRLDDKVYYNHTLSVGEYYDGTPMLCITDITGTITYFITDYGYGTLTLEARDGYEYQTFNGYYALTDEEIPQPLP